MASGSIVGLDIGTQQIKAVELRPGKNGLVAAGMGIAPTPVGILQNNIITDPRLMGQTIKQLLRESGISAKKAVGSVAGQSAVVIRIIEVPKMTDAELKETMKWEVERHVPFAPSETMIDYQPLETGSALDETNPNMEVLLAVAQQDIVNNLVDTMFAAGLDPIAIDIEPLASGRAVLDVVGGHPVVRKQRFVNPVDAPFENNSIETVAVVNIGAANTDISIYQDGQLSFPRSLPLAGDSLTRSIAEMMGYTLDQAERIKRDYASVQLDRMAIYTGTAYGDDPNYQSPGFGEEGGEFGPTDSTRISGRRSARISGRSGRISGRLGGDDLGVFSNPFDLSSDPDTASAAGAEDPAGSLNLGKPTDPADLERTQPMSRGTLNLGRRDEPGGGDGAFAPPPEFEADQGFLGGPASDNDIKDQVFEAIAPVLGELATELRRSLDYFRSRAQGRSVDRVLLVGGSANL
ncbi:MAG: type IV pilus assembly protein PilM, partial [Capsulimonas sp.]|uniref:type IV pilus assembly protein PilM n=1 Tax=Capsulimonas sp. TaxID=2494211 RepID=UPI00326656F4